MDLVEIRKKAKSRKKMGEKKAPSGRKEKSAAVDPGPSREEEPPVEKEYPRKGEGSPPPPDDGAGNEEEADEASRSLASLKGVLLSQHEDDEEEEEEHLQLLVFILGQEEYALNIMDIKEIIRPGEVTEVPKAPDYIQGILSLRGTIIPVMDVNRRLGLPVTERCPENRIVVVKWREHLFGLYVDGVVQVLSIPLTRIEPPPEIIGGVEGEYLGGVGKIEDRLIILLNLVRVLAMEEEIPEKDQLAPGYNK